MPRSSLLVLLALLAGSLPGAATPPTPLPRLIMGKAASTATSPSRPLPFHGKVLAVDATARTLVLNGAGVGRVFVITDQTSLIGKDGAPISLAAIAIGEEVRGSVYRVGEGWQAHKITVGLKETSAAGKARAAVPPAASPTPAGAAVRPAGTMVVPTPDAMNLRVCPNCGYALAVMMTSATSAPLLPGAVTPSRVNHAVGPMTPATAAAPAPGLLQGPVLPIRALPRSAATPAATLLPRARPVEAAR